MKQTIAGVRLKTPEGRFKDAYPIGECSAYRCKKPASHVCQQGTGGEEELWRTIWLCERHLKKHHTAGGADDFQPFPPGGLETEHKVSPPVLLPDAEPVEEAVAEMKTLSVQLSTEAKELEEVLAMVTDYSIDSQEDLDFAAQSLAEVKGEYRKLEEKRKKATGPLREGLKEIDSWFAPAKKALIALEAAWKGKLAQAHLEAQRKQQALMEEAREAHSHGDLLGVQEAMIQAGDSHATTAGVQYREAWRFEVVDESVIPREFMSPDTAKIGATVRLLKDKTDIPGVRVWSEPVVASRSA